MNDQINNGEGFLKEKLGGYQVDPPASVWKTISTRMGGRRRKGMVIVVLAAAASVALAVTLGINYFGQDLPQDREMAEIRDQPQRTTAEPVPQAEVNEGIADQGSRRTPEREDLEEKVVRTFEAVTTETDEPAVFETIPSTDVAEDTHADQTVQAAEIEETKLALTEELAEDLILDAGDPAEEEAEVDLGEMPVRDPRWIIGAAISPLYSFRDAEQQALGATPDHESGTVSYAGGIQVGYRTTRRLAIESGIFYNKMGISIGAPGIQLFSQEYDFAPLGGEADRSSIMAISNSVGNIVSKSGDLYVNNYKLNTSHEANEINGSFASEVNADQGIRQHLDYLEVPFNLRYTLVDRSLKVQLVGGVSTNLLVQNYVTMETADGPTEIGYLTNIRNVNYSGNAGIGLAYHFLEHFSLNLEPRFRYFLNSVNDASLPSTRPYTFGLYTGLSYIF